MFGFLCNDPVPPQEQLPKPYSLPSPLPQWPQGQGFATGTIKLGELEVAMVKDFELVATCTLKRGCVVTFYKPVSIPEGFFPFGYYFQPSHEPQPPTGYVLVARNIQQKTQTHLPPLEVPRHIKMIWNYGNIYVWQPIPPMGYRTLGLIVTKYDKYSWKNEIPYKEVMCVRDDLTLKCYYNFDGDIFRGSCEFVVVNPKLDMMGMFTKGVNVGTSWVKTYDTDYNKNAELDVRCLKNLNPNFEAMPNVKQVEALIHHYGPTVYFHPDEVYLPSSVPWFFHNGGLLLRKFKGKLTAYRDSNLPQAEKNEGDFCLYLPKDSLAKHGNLESAQLYVHVKPALGGTFTDMDMWIFYPFNGPGTCTFPYLFNLNLEDIEHVGGWEHFTLRVSNFDGQLWSVCFSNPDEKWIHVSNLEFIKGNKPAVYSSKSRHAMFPIAGTYIQGAAKLLGIGLMDVVDKSDMFIDASKKFQIIEYPSPWTISPLLDCKKIN